MSKVNVLGLDIDDPSLSEILDYVDSTIKYKENQYIATINSELLQLSLSNPVFKNSLNQASLRLCDGIGVQWAATFTSQPYPVFINILRAPLSLARLLIQPSSAQSVIKHRTTGRLLFEDLLAHASNHGYSVFFLGGGEGVAKQVVKKAQNQYPKLIVAGCFSGHPEQAEQVIQTLQPSNLLFVAYGSPKQEIFIHNYLDQLKSNITIGVGGTFDAFVGAKPIGSAFRQIRPPQWVHRLGLESFWRLATQPNRYKRVFKSIIGLIKIVITNSINDE